MRARTTFAILLLAAAAFAPSARAQDADSPAVTAILDPRRIAVGGQATFTIETTGAPADTLPRQLSGAGLTIDYAGHNSSIQIVNGQRTERYSYVYSVVASAPGRFTIPPVRVTINGRAYTTPSQELVVDEASAASAVPDARSPCFLELEVPGRDIYVGEVVPLKLTLYVVGRNTISGVGQPEMERENLVMKRFPTSPQSGSTEIDGRIYSTVTLETSLFAIAEGRVTIGPCTLPAMFYESQEYARVPSIFRRANRQNITSNAVELNVKPLPEEGRPDDFTGAVGTFSLVQNASPTRLQAGDPISVDLQITGIGNFDSLEPPMMTATDGWQIYPSRELVQNLSDGVTSGQVTYTQVIIPLEQKREIPPFRFSYFDPHKEAYVVAKSDPVPIEVAPDRGIAAIDRGSETPGLPASASRPPADRPVADLEDILTIVTEPPSLRKAGAGGLLRSPLFWAAQSLPAIAFLGLMGTGVRHRWLAWRAARSMEPARRSFDEILSGMRGGSLSRREFYREALECIEAAVNGNTPPAELASLEAAAFAVLYDAGHERSPALSPAESRAVIEILARHSPSLNS